MGARHPNPRRIKIHRPCTVGQMAATLSVHKNTVRLWAEDGLRSIEDRRPWMFRGADAAALLGVRRQAVKRRCAPGEMYCLPCRIPKSPASLVADLYAKAPTVGWLVAIRPTGSRMSDVEASEEARVHANTLGPVGHDAEAEAADVVR
jgi:hypothetical protein